MKFTHKQTMPNMELAAPYDGMDIVREAAMGALPSQQEFMEEGSSSTAYGHGNVDGVNVKKLIEDFIVRFQVKLPENEDNRKRITKDHLEAVQKAKGVLVGTVDLVGKLEIHIGNHLKMEEKLLAEGHSQWIVDLFDSVMPLATLWLVWGDQDDESDQSGTMEIQCEE
ncbi:hypothetical protein BN14_11319 [Rhizoctonia solani AG-1 IB]|uniref:Uncharacterized protein n=1 Tax=Thanatephorus cucumeris (strain AG1-IB / isolate 7/3/14) TaxID=1108050 RepID=M5CH33_THACB|nr:hypothetical protein BN14_11319 [Rhizoctonia solani AG-1 IB]